jgi:hypothetical protein
MVGIDENYQKHQVFNQLDQYSGFYKDLSFLVFQYIGQGTGTIGNIDTYVYSSMQGTLESIRMVLHAGRINDAFALLRKYWDLTVINVYTNLYIADNFSLENFTVQKIADWIKGKEKLPSFNTMSEYIATSPKAKDLTLLIYESGSFKDSKFEKIRKRCNDFTHYNYYQHLILNDNEILLSNRLTTLNGFSQDLQQIFILHLSYLFLLNEHYLRSTDFTDSLDIGLTTDDSAQYLVAPFVQKIFNDVIRPNRPDIVELIKINTEMKLE